MALARVGGAELIDKISRVFRRHGYEGATMSRLSAATGLERASLYPPLSRGERTRWSPPRPLPVVPGSGSMCCSRSRSREMQWRSGQGGLPATAGGSDDDGRRPCVLESLSLPAGNEKLHRALNSSLEVWLEAFTQLARKSGFSPAAARDRAEQAVSEIEGSLVLARVRGDSGPFLRTIRKLPKLLTEVSA